MAIVKIVEIVGESPKSWDEAMRNLISEVQETLQGITRIGVKAMDVRLEDDAVEVYRVRAEVSFRVLLK